MTERCRNCGAELFAGQQFCRQCGARTGLLSHDDVATQIFPPGQQQHHQPPPRPGAPPTATAPIGHDRTTDPNFGPRPAAAYQPPQQVVPHPSHLPAPVPARRRGSSFIWILLGLFFVVMGGVITTGVILYRQTRPASVTRKVIVAPPVPAIPPIPPVPPMPPNAADNSTDTLDETGAEVSSDKTVITKTFPLALEDGTFEVKNFNGDITIEGWDEPQAEVKVTKRGGTPNTRAGMRVKLEHEADHLALSTEAGVAAQITYEVKLPRRLAHIGLNTLNGNVKLTGVQGGLEINTQNGNIRLEDVAGEISTKTMHGNTKVVLADEGHDAEQVFNSLNGNIEVELPEDINANLKAEATTGAIEVDDALGLTVTKQIVGQRAAGQLGHGGPALVLKTLSGNIKLKQ